MKQNNLDNILWETIKSIVELERRPFSYMDVVEKGVKISKTNFRNKISQLLKAGKIEVIHYSPQGFYAMTSVGKKSMTDDRTGVTSPLRNKCNYRHLSNDPVYRIIQNIPLGKRSVHDIRLKFSVKGIWSALSSKFKPNERSKDLKLIPWPWKINDLDIKVIVHATDTVEIDIGCSYYPVAVDTGGVIRLSNALVIVRERLSNIIENCTSQYPNPTIPEHMAWVVMMWHFGRDALIEYKGENFYTTWEVAEHALITAYIKEWAYGEKRLRIEKQEYPRKSLAEALEEKLNGVRTLEDDKS
jgi:hypothetical protein